MTVRSILRLATFGVWPAGPRWLPLSAALWACNARSLEEPKRVADLGVPERFQETVNRDIDIVFLIDDSLVDGGRAERVEHNFPRFMQRARGLPRRPTERPHRGHLLGHGRGRRHQRLRDFGNNGVFQYTAHCLPGLTPSSPARHHPAGRRDVIVNENGTANYTAPSPRCSSAWPSSAITGCGSRAAPAVAQPRPRRGRLRSAGREPGLPAARRLPRRSSSSPTRTTARPRTAPTARCSARRPTPWPGQFGPVQSFRCNEFGHICAAGAPNRNAPNNMATDMVTYTDCVSDEASRYLKPVGEFVDEDQGPQARSGEPDPRRRHRRCAANNPNGDIPYVVRWAPAPVPDTGPWPIITPGCGMNATGCCSATRRSASSSSCRRSATTGCSSICQTDYAPCDGGYRREAEPAHRAEVHHRHAGRQGRGSGERPAVRLHGHRSHPGAAGGAIDRHAACLPAPTRRRACWRLDPGNATNGCRAGSFVMAWIAEPRRRRAT